MSTLKQSKRDFNSWSFLNVCSVLFCDQLLVSDTSCRQTLKKFGGFRSLLRSGEENTSRFFRRKPGSVRFCSVVGGVRLKEEAGKNICCKLPQLALSLQNTHALTHAHAYTHTISEAHTLERTHALYQQCPHALKLCRCWRIFTRPTNSDNSTRHSDSAD